MHSALPIEKSDVPPQDVREAGIAEAADLFPKPEKTFDSSIQFC